MLNVKSKVKSNVKIQLRSLSAVYQGASQYATKASVSHSSCLSDPQYGANGLNMLQMHQLDSIVVAVFWLFWLTLKEYETSMLV